MPACRTARAWRSCCSTCRRSTTPPAPASGPPPPGTRPSRTGPTRTGTRWARSPTASTWRCQRTGEGTAPRWHVDIETDDIPAEVARLEALGARRLADMGRFWQLTDPAGLVFCVVGIQTGAEFERYATTWP